jgi:uncharacterized damage-inducible protein DinB
MNQIQSLRAHLVKLLDWEDAHAGLDKVVDGIPPELRGKIPTGLPYSPWQLLEHLRLTQRDILDFCRNPQYQEREWPDDYWPKSPVPPHAKAWNESVQALRSDLTQLKELANDSDIDLFAPIPHGAGQTYLRELLLVADHNAYHGGEMVVVRRSLGAWG